MASRGTLVVAMSGGVDSGVAAALLLEDGWDVIGMTLRLVSCDDGARDRFCCGVDAESLARETAMRLGFPHYVIDASEAFEQTVLAPAWRDYSRGRTPSPCPRCNRDLKLGLLVDRALRLGADGVATGHYARRSDGDDGPGLWRGVDPARDQSYFLFALGPARLARAFFPLGALSKADVRRKATALGLGCAARPSSQDACLAGPGGTFAEALRGRFGAEALPGAIEDRDGRILGAHEGIHRFTVGQRRGLGVALGRPAWVSAVHPERAAVVVTTDPADLDAVGLLASDPTWLAPPPTDRSLGCEVQVRYRARPVAATVECSREGVVRALFAEPQRAVTPGQAAVFYRGARVLGGAWIDAPLRA